MSQIDEETTENLELSIDAAPADGFIRIGRVELPAQLPEFDEQFYAWKREFWSRKLRDDRIRYIVAPMVDQSELAFRMMMHSYGAQLFFTPMIHAQLFVKNLVYRRNAFASVPEDRPLIVQFCANDPDIFLDACRLVEGYCDGVDLNLGCPQIVAKRGHYGSFLQEEPELIAQMVSKVFRHCRLPISVKIRVLDDVTNTINYARIIEKSGAAMLTVHGRTREQRGVKTGVADWQRIRKVCEALRIPVIANGNIQMPGDAERCLETTGARAVMSAEGLLSNPALFMNKLVPSFELAAEYLDYAERFQAPTCSVRAHIFRICHYSLLEFPDLRERVSYVSSYEQFGEVVKEIRRRCGTIREVDGADYLDGTESTLVEKVNKLPHYYAKPYIRPATSNEKSESEYRNKRREEMDKIQAETGLSYKQIRKRERRRLDMKKLHSLKAIYSPCSRCKQPAGTSCEMTMCRKCCRFLCTRHDRTCLAHQNHGLAIQKRRQAFADSHSITVEQLLSGDYEVNGKPGNQISLILNGTI